MGSFTGMTRFSTGMIRFITGAVRLMTGVMRLVLTWDALRARVVEPAVRSDMGQPCETSFISSRAASITRFGVSSTRSLGESPSKWLLPAICQETARTKLRSSQNRCLLDAREWEGRQNAESIGGIGEV